MQGLLRNHFPKSSKLSKVFNRNAIKLSYSCMGNLNNLVKKQNVINVNLNINEQKIVKETVYVTVRLKLIAL